MQIQIISVSVSVIIWILVICILSVFAASTSADNICICCICGPTVAVYFSGLVASVGLQWAHLCTKVPQTVKKGGEMPKISTLAKLYLYLQTLQLSNGSQIVYLYLSVSVAPSICVHLC